MLTHIYFFMVIYVFHKLLSYFLFDNNLKIHDEFNVIPFSSGVKYHKIFKFYKKMSKNIFVSCDIEFEITKYYFEKLNHLIVNFEEQNNVDTDFIKLINLLIMNYLRTKNLLVRKKLGVLNANSIDSSIYCDCNSHEKIFYKISENEIKNFIDYTFLDCLKDRICVKKYYAKDLFTKKGRKNIKILFFHVFFKVLISDDFKEYCIQCIVDQYIIKILYCKGYNSNLKH